jgi:hypothetical protein
MTKTVSLHNIWVARIAGLFVLTALAVGYFAFPMLTLAQVVRAPQLLPSTDKVTFMGLVSAPLPTNLVDANGKPLPLPKNAALDLTRTVKVPFNSLQVGSCLACTVTQDNQPYGFKCTINLINPDTKKIEVLLGTPSSKAMTSQAVIQEFQGNFAFLTLTEDNQGNVIVPPGDDNSGWGTPTLSTLS